MEALHTIELCNKVEAGGYEGKAGNPAVSREVAIALCGKLRDAIQIAGGFSALVAVLLPLVGDPDANPQAVACVMAQMPAILARVASLAMIEVE